MNKKGKYSSFVQTLTIVFAGVLLYWGLTNYKVVEHWLSLGAEILSSFVIGILLALILNVPMSFIERSLFKPRKNGKPRGKLSEKLARPVSLTLTFIGCLAAIAAVCALLIPQLKSTAKQLYDQLPLFIDKAFEIAENNSQLNEMLNEAELSADKVINTIIKKLNNPSFISKTLSGTINIASGMVSGTVNFVIGIVFSIYMLARKETLKSQLYAICSAYLPDKLVKKLAHIGNLSKSTFSGFISGQGLEACILGTLCAVGMKIFGFPYAAAIGVLVAVTAFIPIVGAFIGTGIGAFLILMSSLKQALFFILFMIILQQIEGNLIYPRVVGKSVGLPSLWVLFAITVGGNIGGILGMFVAVPICSVIYCLLRDSVQYRNEMKKTVGDVPEWLS